MCYDPIEQYILAKGKTFWSYCAMVNFCAIYGCSNHSNREKDESHFWLPAIITRPKDKKHALYKEHRATWLARIWRDDLSSNPRNFVRVWDGHWYQIESSYPHSPYTRAKPGACMFTGLFLILIREQSLELACSRVFSSSSSCCLLVTWSTSNASSDFSVE